MSMHKYEVGKLYSQRKTVWPEGVDYNFRRGQHELRIFYRSPSPHEIESIRTGTARFAFCVQDDILFFMYKFGDLDWGDSTFSIYLVPEDERMPPPEMTPTQHALLTVLLIDAETGILRVIRAVTFPPKFAGKFHAAIRAQFDQPMPDDYVERAMRVYKRYTSADLAKKRAVARCVGGTQEY